MTKNELRPDRGINELPGEIFDPSGKFWLEASRIQAVDDIINGTNLSTMALGVESNYTEAEDVRKRLKGVLFSEDDPLSEELRRAFNVGFMYGRLVATPSIGSANSQDEDGPIPQKNEVVLADLEAGMQIAMQDLDLREHNDSYLFFTRLRRLELLLAKSDILAYSLAVTQDHMRNEFERNHRTEADLTRPEIRRLQTVYYAGSMAGALMTVPVDRLNQPPIEILRSMQQDVEPISIRLEFEPGERLGNDLDYALSSKLNFQWVSSEDNKGFFAVMPSAFQYGPNAISLPFYQAGIDEPEYHAKVPIDEVQAIITAEEQPDRAAPTLVAHTDLSEEFLDKLRTKKVVGLIAHNNCVASFDKSHPNAAVATQLTADVLGIDKSEVGYVSELTRVEIDRQKTKVDWFLKHSLGVTAVSAAAAVWLVDVFGAVAVDQDIEYDLNVEVSAVILLGFYVLNRVKKTLAHNAKVADKDYQELLDQITLER